MLDTFYKYEIVIICRMASQNSDTLSENFGFWSSFFWRGTLSKRITFQ